MRPKVRAGFFAVAAVLALSVGALAVTSLLGGPSNPRPGPPAEVRIGESMTVTPSPGPSAPTAAPAPPSAPPPPPAPPPQAEVVPPPVLDRHDTGDSGPNRPRMSVVRPPDVSVQPRPPVVNDDNNSGDRRNGGDDGGEEGDDD